MHGMEHRILKNKKNILFGCFFCFCVVGIIKFYMLHVFVICPCEINSDKIGIIDECLFNIPDNVEYHAIEMRKNTCKTHGDNLIEFLKKIGYHKRVFYFGASVDGKIGVENIVHGLEWMKKKGVTKVNISLSSKIYDKKLDEWISQNRDIKVFASYNNLTNTAADYPAMYKAVIGSGCDYRINYKCNDKKYRSNNIVILGNEVIIDKYIGNSYLSVLTMIEME